MPGLAETLLALGLVMGGHEMGHNIEADRQNVPFKSGVVWKALTEDKKKLARIANAGFEGQDIVTGALGGTKLERPARLISGLNKIGYALKPGSFTGGTGDVKMIEQNRGKKARQALQGMLLISGMSDIFNTKKSFGIGQSSKGTPMLTFGGKF